MMTLSEMTSAPTHQMSLYTAYAFQCVTVCKMTSSQAKYADTVCKITPALASYADTV